MTWMLVTNTDDAHDSTDGINVDLPRLALVFLLFHHILHTYTK